MGVTFGPGFPIDSLLILCIDFTDHHSDVYNITSRFCFTFLFPSFYYPFVKIQTVSCLSNFFFPIISCSLHLARVTLRVSIVLKRPHLFYYPRIHSFSSIPINFCKYRISIGHLVLMFGRIYFFLCTSVYRYFYIICHLYHHTVNSWLVYEQ